ncbi:hypothetical protein Poly41_49280 [Novipirellula artificiosorum]|uniref:Sialate O-acetylesterase domain-containing protein n=1 Tax=Novipirellula artificiosorum TaxID=2528016 RepID=A0A5C6DB81_9BACT|nr:hypothetical protein Poly41_49280 [Novipirellula artificiosorum]
MQIAPFAYKQEPVSAAFLREVQMMALSEPNTGMVVTMDIGDPTNIHPKQKKPVGERLAGLALSRDYGRKHIVDSGPLFQYHEVDGASIRLYFTELGSGLATRDGMSPTHFTIAAEDRDFVTANAVIDGDTIVVSHRRLAVRIVHRSSEGCRLRPRVGCRKPSTLFIFRRVILFAKAMVFGGQGFTRSFVGRVRVNALHLLRVGLQVE